MNKVVTRFAPSPTGFMHIGGIRTALYAWLFARKEQHGNFILRIEDTDKNREVSGSIPHIVESLKWLGIDWDEGIDIGGPNAPYLQSERLHIYKTYAQKLVDKGCAYPDPYTQSELSELREKAKKEKSPFLFRDYRPKKLEIWDGTKPLRFRAPKIKRYEWNDTVRGHLSAGEEAVDDFILIKNDGYPTYNFAHIVDDIEMGVTHVMRGEEFISSTPKFLSLYEALDVTPPIFVTVPVIFRSGDKKKLSKRDGAKDILEYRDEGFLPEAMMNFLALLGWNPGTTQEFFSKSELIEVFDLHRIQLSGAGFDEIKLRSINQYWMRKLSDNDFIVHLNIQIQKSILQNSDFKINNEELKKIIPLLKERAQTFKEAAEMLYGELSHIFIKPSLDRKILLAKKIKDTSDEIIISLERIVKIIETLPENVSAESIKEAIMPLANKEEEKGKGGRGAILWPLRYALSGEERSPDPFFLIAILGKTEAILRIREAINLIRNNT